MAITKPTTINRRMNQRKNLRVPEMTIAPNNRGGWDFGCVCGTTIPGFLTEQVARSWGANHQCVNYGYLGRTAV